MLRSPRFFAEMVFLAFFIAGCGGGSSYTPAPEPLEPAQSTIAGTAIKGPIQGATVRVFRFDANGGEVELFADNEPVVTDVNGGFRFTLSAADIAPDVGPLVIMTQGGNMYAENAPQLSAVIPNPESLATAGSRIDRHLTVASSVAAGLLRRDATAIGYSPSSVDAETIIDRVERGLGVSLLDGPSNPATDIAFFNNSIDMNLNLIEMPQNAPAVDDFVDYLVMNFASETARLDDRMVNPADSTNKNFNATFNGVGSGALANVMPGGPSTCMLFNATLDRSSIENDGLDTAWVNITLMDAQGSPAGDGRVVNIQTTEGRLVISKNAPMVRAGNAAANISSVWAGNAKLEVAMTLPVGTVVSHSFDLAVSDTVADVEDTTYPRVVSAGSTSNTEVLVSFSEAMRGGIESAENPAHYRVVATESLASGNDLIQKGDPTDPVAEAPEVLIEEAQLLLPDRMTVRLTTFSQSDLEYEVVVVNLTDLVGNSMAPPDGSVDPSTAVFQGIPPNGGTSVDSDGDGLSDADEQRGWVVTIVSADGTTITLEVTSDPFSIDTDGDGVTDANEFQGGLNPRSADSDGDTLSDYMEWHVILSNGLKQDTDGDGLQDGVEFNVYRTSPILADTDGDQMPDPEEIAAGNRNPLISDLPSPRIDIGNVNLQLDTRFSFTSEAGEAVVEENSFESTITRGEDETFSTSNENSTKKTLEFSQEIGATYKVGTDPGWEFNAKVGSRQGSERGSTFTTSKESSKSSEETYHDSLSTTTSRDIRESVTREIVDATMKVTMSIDNVGDIPFTISNLELSAQAQDPLDRRSMIPIAAMVPENEGLGSVNIGTLGDPSRGPFIFKTVSVFPQQVQELMKNPRGLVVQLANFDITDNDGNNFAFTSQEVLDRTAGLTFDLGDGRVESFRVATASTHDPATGKSVGITMAYMLEIIGLQRFETIRDGGNGVAETAAFGDDLALVGAGLAVEPGEIVVKAGANGAITSLPGGDDKRVPADYETTLQRDFDRIRDGGNGVAETLAVGDDVQFVAQGALVNPGEIFIAVGDNEILDTPVAVGDDVIVRASVPDHEVLTRFRDVAVDSAAKRFWVLFVSQTRFGVDLDDYVIRAGEQFDFAYVQDKDDDGVWAREEFLHGSSDLLPNTDGCTVVPPGTLCDVLSDKEEIQDGWRVQLRGSPEGFLVYPNPNQGDSDRDTLTDDQERACLLDPRQRDTDLDGLTDWEEINGKILIEGVITNMVSRDYDTNQVTYVITPYAGIDPAGTGVIPHDVIPGCSPSGFATDPLNDDTDGDLIDDWLELQLGLNPNDSTDGPTFLDDDGDGVPNSIEMSGWTRAVNGSSVLFTSNPNTADSDNDLLPDLLEFYLGGDPLSHDTDDDLISDTNEYRTGGEACVTETTGAICVLFTDRVTFNYLEYVNKCASATACDNANTEQNLANARARQYGTNLSESDSDFDSLDDRFEPTMRTIAVNGAIIPVDSDPLDPNSDDDLLGDGDEFVAGTNPRIGDTDGDGTYDDAEAALGRDPTITDKRINVTVTKAIVVTGQYEDIDPRINVDVSFNDAPFVHVADFDGDDIDDGESFGGAPKELSELVYRSTDRLMVKFSGSESDSGTNDSFETVSTIVTIDTPGPDGEEAITLDMKEPEGENHVRFVVTIREISVP